ncbi:hypothetical protein [Halomarina litorea]|nr:hypothetical protein [Halomarina sp. BCD28]
MPFHERCGFGAFPDTTTTPEGREEDLRWMVYARQTGSGSD